MSKELMCLACGNEWNYEGSATRATCPRCKIKLIINPTNKHYVSIDLEKHGQGIVKAVKAGKKRAIFDCIGYEIVDVSIID